MWKRFKCFLYGHDPKDTENVVEGFLQVYYIAKCTRCGKKTIGSMV